MPRPKTLCVDDEPINLDLLEAMLVPRGYEVIKAQNGVEALVRLTEQKIDIVLLDVMMPEMNGLEVCKAIRESEKFRNIPVMLTTALRSIKDRVKGIEAGADDFISKPFDQAEILARMGMLLKMKDLNERLRASEEALSYTVSTLARTSDVNDEDMGNHIIRVGEYCTVIAKHLRMPEEFVDNIRLHAQMHDIGKIYTKPEILKKPDRLSFDEFEEVKKHTIYGARILGSHVRFTMAKEIAVSHHERWDGSGYPYGLKGDQIPLTGRILNIADQYDVIRNERTYKPSYDHETTCRIITEGNGRTLPHHFDPVILSAFINAASQFEEIYEKLR